MEKSCGYYLYKANLEYNLDELKRCKESLLEAINRFRLNEAELIIMFNLASLCSCWDEVIRKIRVVYLENKNLSISNKCIENIFLLCCGEFSQNEYKVDEILQVCNNDIEKSIIIYLISRNIRDKNIQLEYCKVSLGLWKENIAAGEIILRYKNKVSPEIVCKLIELEKLNNMQLIEHQEKSTYDFNFIPLGGGNNVGASSYYIDINGVRVLIDCGVEFKGNDYELPNFKLLDEIGVFNSIKYVIITHAHLDHCGAILDLYKMNKSIKFIMTRETRELLKLNIMSLEISKKENYILEELIQKIITIDFRRKFPIDSNETYIELYRAGHILGAASVMIRNEKCNVFITGNYCLRNQNLVQGMDIPEDHIDILITENTYGNKIVNKSFLNEKLELSNYISEKLAQRKQVLIPAFALGRTQEVLDVINSNDKKNVFRTYIDGTSIEGTKIYEKYIDKKIVKNRTYYVNDSFYSSKEQFISEEIMTNTCCIVASSGMLLEGSASAEYAKQILTSENGVCVLIGYQANNTIGAKIKEQAQLQCERYINIEGKCYKIAAEIKSFNLSAHASMNEILALQYYTRAKNVILVHGDNKGEKSILETKLSDIGNINVYQSKNNELIKL